MRQVSPEDDSRMVSPREVARLQARIVDVGSAFWGDAIGADRVEVTVAASDFFALYPDRPVYDNSGGSGYNDCFWLYTAARLIKPSLIVESGVYRGQTSWLLRRACPDAQLVCFDVDLSQLVYHDASIRYHEADWMEVALDGADRRSSLCFFDDHVNQARRVQEAYERGFGTLLFDDDLPAESLYGTGRPPVPTISMLFDDGLKPGQCIEWLRHGRQHRYIFDPADTFGARALIQSRHATPDLTPIVRSRPQGGLVVVKLIDWCREPERARWAVARAHLAGGEVLLPAGSHGDPYRRREALLRR